MKKLLTILFLFSSVVCFGQADYDSITVPFNGSGGTFKAMLHLPGSYGTGNTYYPIIIFFHGAGQHSPNLADLYSSPDGGYAYQQVQGKIKPTIHNKKDGKDYEFIYLSPQGWGGAAEAPTAQEADFIISYMYTHYRVDTSRLYMTGLSAGGQTCVEYVGKSMATGETNYKHHDVAAMALMSENGSALMLQAQADTCVADSVGAWCFGSSDTQGQNTLNFRFYGDAFAGRKYVDTTSYSGGHCCWVQFYDSSYRKKLAVSGDTMSIQEWFLTKTSQHSFVQPTTRPPYIVSPAEYVCSILNTATNKANIINGDTTSFPNMPICVHTVASGPHNAAMVDCNGDLWLQGDNGSGLLAQGDSTAHTGFVKVGNDSLGVPIAHIKEVVIGGTPYGGNWFVAALDSSGHIHVAGNTEGGLSGNGTWGARASMKMITIPGSQFFTKIRGSSFLDALDSTGTEYRWGGGNGFSAQYVLAQGTSTPTYNAPTAVSFPGSSARVTGISVGGLWTFSTLADGKVYSSSYYGQMTSTGSGGWGNGPTAVNTEVRVDTSLSTYMPSGVKKIVSNSAGNYLLLNDSTLWYSGDIACGEGGNGLELDFANYTTNPSPYNGTNPHPYEWSQNLGELFQRKFVQIAPGQHNFIDVFATPGLCFSAWAEDVNSNLYSWGRGKGGILGDGVNEVGTAINSQYPNSYDRPWITKINPYRSTTIPVTSPVCIINPSGVPCNSYAIPANTKPVPSLVLSVLPGNRIKLDASASTDNVAINYYTHTQIGGGAVNMLVQTGPIDTTSAATSAGLRTFKFVAKDNGHLSDSVTASIMIGPTANAGNDQTITLPTSSAGLSGSGSTTGGASMTYLWTKISGSGTTTILGNTTQTPTVSGLQQGVYVFQLQITDSNGFTATDTVQVTVNVGVDCHCFILKY